MARSSRHEHLSHAMGASVHLIAGENPAAQAATALGGAPDVVFECVGTPGMINLAMNCVGRKGTVVVMGFCTVADTLGPSDFLFKELKLVYSNTYSTREFEIVADAMDAGAVEPRSMVTDTVSLNNLPQVFEALRTPTGQSKVMLDPWAA
jgi:(R,R)-butanediol dehydrogenase/meso-butanediol dehydrogenase/diacetyl reductase